MKCINFLRDNIIISEDKAENDYSLSYYASKFVWVLKNFDITELGANNLPIDSNKYME